MTKITNEELIDKLNYLKNKRIELNLEGTITTSFKCNIDKVIKTEDYICILDNQNEKNIKLNSHQIMKINVISNNEILIHFDGLQSLYIIEND